MGLAGAAPAANLANKSRPAMGHISQHLGLSCTLRQFHRGDVLLTDLGNAWCCPSLLAPSQLLKASQRIMTVIYPPIGTPKFPDYPGARRSLQASPCGRKGQFSQVWKNTNQTAARMRTAKLTLVIRSNKTDGPRSACRASVGFDDQRVS
jgi:hypothetical protein